MDAAIDADVVGDVGGGGGGGGGDYGNDGADDDSGDGATHCLLVPDVPLDNVPTSSHGDHGETVKQKTPNTKRRKKEKSVFVAQTVLYF